MGGAGGREGYGLHGRPAPSRQDHPRAGIAEGYTNRVYLNWDVLTDRTRLIREPYFFEAVERRDSSPPIVILDEIHKCRDWKNYLKGAYDRFHKEYQFLVTGSGRLDTYRSCGLATL